MIFGMATRDKLPENAIPVDAVAVVKYLEEDGEAAWLLTGTESLTDMEALGMLTAAQGMQLKDLSDRFEDPE